MTFRALYHAAQRALRRQPKATPHSRERVAHYMNDAYARFMFEQMAQHEPTADEKIAIARAMMNDRRGYDAYTIH